MYDLEEKINFSVFPGHQGGPHNHTITALAVALGQALKPEFKEYAQQVVKNAKVLEEEFKKRGYDLASGGTGIANFIAALIGQTPTWSSSQPNRRVWMELAPNGFWRLSALPATRTHCRLVTVCECRDLISDTSALNPGGIRVGAPAMTTRGFKEEQFGQIVDFIDRAIKVAAEVQKSLPKEANKLKDWKAAVGDGSGHPELVKLRKEVNELCGKYPLPGFVE